MTSLADFTDGALLFQMLSDVLVGIIASSLWALAAFVVYRREQRRTRRLAFAMLVPTLDRLRDTFVALQAVARAPSKHQHLELEVERYELLLLRLVDQVNREWVLSHLPAETDGLNWHADSDFLFGNTRELANELLTIRHSLRLGAPATERKPHFNSVRDQCKDLAECADGQLDAIATAIPKMFNRTTGLVVAP